jgi:predicted ATPase
MLSALLTSPAPATPSPGASRERPGGDIHVADGVRAPDELAALKLLITEKTEGNPFFMEEMVQNLFEEGALVRNGEIRLTRPLSRIRIPATVQAMLAARIDRLPADEKDLLQTLAVIGREFPLLLVALLLATPDDEINRMLSDLQLGEFIYEQPAAGGIEYIFKHALTQEVAYNSILVERRKQIHERTAQVIESLFAESLDDHCTDLAHHYGRSDNALKAVNYLHLAAQQAMNRSAYVEASGQLTTAIELLRTLPDNIDRDRTEVAVRFSLAVCVNLSVPGAAMKTATVENSARKSATTPAASGFWQLSHSFTPAVSRGKRSHAPSAMNFSASQPVCTTRKGSGSRRFCLGSYRCGRATSLGLSGSSMRPTNYRRAALRNGR